MLGDKGPRGVDLLVVGSGIAGLVAAISAAEAGQTVHIVTKAGISDSNTHHAQGGIAAAIGPNDSATLHAQDTLACGGGLNDPNTARIAADEGRYAVEFLTDRGVEFDRQLGQFELGREAAHSEPRIVHNGDTTGVAIQRALVSTIRRQNVPVLEHAYVTELEVGDSRVQGIRALVDGRETACRAERVLLATGGAGQIYGRTTNPAVATGDGLALAYRAGAEVMDMEFFQFHPTALAVDGYPPTLISEAIRGAGAVLRTARGEAFMNGFHADGDLAPRDVVSRAIWTELTRTGSRSVMLDLGALDSQQLAVRFPKLVQTCREVGLDPARDSIPIAPAAHYFMGGVRADIDGHTSLPGLLAAGEVACTGFHGANRLASNSLLEGVVTGMRIASTVAESLESASASVHISSPISKEPTLSRQELQRRSWLDIGIVRSGPSLAQTVSRHLPSGRPSSPMEWEAANLALVARLIAQAALQRTESRGAHFREDYPETSTDWESHIVLTRDADDDGVWRAVIPVATSAREPVHA